MTTPSPFAPEEKPSAKALVLSAMVHLLLLGALFFGVQWKSQAPAIVGVEIWRGTSAPAKTPSKPVEKLPPKPVEPPPEPVEPPPEPVEPPPEPVEPPPEPVKPPPEPEVKPPADPDIIAKEKEEELKKREREEADRKKAAEEEQKKLEQKKAAEEEQKKLAQKKAEEEAQKKLAQKKAAEAAQRRAENDARLRDELAAEQALRAMANQIGRDDYAAKIRGKIKGNIVLPRAIQGNPEAIFEVRQLPTGEVIDVRIQKSSGNTPLDEAIERAIHKSSPLPKPDQANLFERVLILKYKPYDE